MKILILIMLCTSFIQAAEITIIGAAALDFPATMEGAVESADRISALVHKIVFARETRR